jgi:hypothetical protein
VGEITRPAYCILHFEISNLYCLNNPFHRLTTFPFGLALFFPDSYDSDFPVFTDFYLAQSWKLMAAS